MQAHRLWTEKSIEDVVRAWIRREGASSGKPIPETYNGVPILCKEPKRVRYASPCYTFQNNNPTSQLVYVTVDPDAKTVTAECSPLLKPTQEYPTVYTTIHLTAHSGVRLKGYEIDPRSGPMTVQAPGRFRVYPADPYGFSSKTTDLIFTTWFGDDIVTGGTSRVGAINTIFGYGETEDWRHEYKTYPPPTITTDGAWYYYDPQLPKIRDYVKAGLVTSMGSNNFIMPFIGFEPYNPLFPRWAFVTPQTSFTIPPTPQTMTAKNVSWKEEQQ